MEDPTLFMLCDPKKCKKEQKNMDAFLNNYEIHSNNLNDNIDSSSDNDSIEAEELPKEEIPEHMLEIITNINNIDNFILNNNYDENMEKINDYLIDLLFLIKSKKNKK